MSEVLGAARQPRKHPPGVTPKLLAGDAFARALDSGGLKGRVWHESLTPAQETVCRWIWETCGRHFEPWEQFEFGFLCEYNTSHELAVWVRIALVFEAFVERYRSVDKKVVIGELCRLSAGAEVLTLKGGRAKDLKRLWEQGPQEQDEE